MFSSRTLTDRPEQECKWCVALGITEPPTYEDGTPLLAAVTQ